MTGKHIWQSTDASSGGSEQLRDSLDDATNVNILEIPVQQAHMIVQGILEPAAARVLMRRAVD